MELSACSLTDCGLPGIRKIPYGVHMCHVYGSRRELVAALVPYFIAGLRSNERCIWICAEPLAALDAKLELAKAGVDAEAAIQSGALILRDFSEWYAESDELKGTDVVELWLRAEARALAEGYNGIRITGNVSFLPADGWDLFMEYEKALDEALSGRRIVTLCTYPRDAVGAAEIFDVVRRHNCALERPDEGGVKGAGEGGTILRVAAVVSALADAIGAKVNEYPLSPERIVELLEKRGSPIS